ncbi:hypothetical protein BOW53_00190 [Solemya pervernicosa gill symbiont]|uniref:DUF3135 domain-containing protein n=2 Tax=Gammaproteobacteria incertae sedis TaxID=118884 RepID=A0A1T2LB18_9GAMM|nr:DUF3135 domain-containing protein [Candidatus Reidiella endopervernicosa]OOZ42299.1 hypothetical protein BOW53_00190 [Solemya pervernicosa gill symbiont]QKQ25694.1 DUF3135 domain-containing protein [Candidatus Reidiella endopervernicosa]
MGLAASARIDFDEWSDLANADPAAFEARRSELLEGQISRCASRSQTRLRRLQWRIDQIRRLSSSPLGACVKINDMMMNTVLGEGGLLATMSSLSNPPPDGQYRQLPKAKVIRYHPREPKKH